MHIAQTQQNASGSGLVADDDVPQGAGHQTQLGQVGVQTHAGGRLQSGRSTDQRLSASADHRHMHPRAHALNGTGAAAQIDVQGQILKGRTGRPTQTAASGLDLTGHEGARGLHGNGAVLGPQAIECDVSGADELQAQIAGVRTVEISQGAGIAALAEVGHAAQGDLAHIGGCQPPRKHHFKAVIAQGDHGDIVAGQQRGSSGQGDCSYQGALDVGGQRAGRSIPGNRWRHIRPGSPGQ